MTRPASGPYRLTTVRVFATDLGRSVSFYRDLVGLPLTTHDVDAGFAIFAVGAVDLLVEHLPATDPEAGALLGRFLGASLEVDDVFATYVELTGRGVRFDHEPRRQPWGGVMTHLRDPDDNVLTLYG